MSSRGHTQSSSRRDGFSSLNLKYLLLALYSVHNINTLKSDPNGARVYTKTKGVREYTSLTGFSQLTGVRDYTTGCSEGYTKIFREPDPCNVSSDRAHSVFHPESTHSALLPCTRESIIDLAVS